MDDNDFAENAIEPLIVEKAKDYRKDNPGLGCAKLYVIIKRLFESTGCMPGRDAFIELLRANGLMVQIKRRRHYRTTDSNHHYRKYDNLAREIVPMRPNELWVSDITYVETDEGVCYLSLITDAYSHKVRPWRPFIHYRRCGWLSRRLTMIPPPGLYTIPTVGVSIAAPHTSLNSRNIT